MTLIVVFSTLRLRTFCTLLHEPPYLIVSKNEKPKRPRRSVTKINDCVFDMQGCLSESCKREVGKERFAIVKTGEDATKCPQEHPACTELLRRSGEGRGGDWTSNNRPSRP